MSVLVLVRVLSGKCGSFCIVFIHHFHLTLHWIGLRRIASRTNKVVPLSPEAGVLEWVNGTAPLGSFLLDRGQSLGVHSGGCGLWDSWVFSSKIIKITGGLTGELPRIGDVLLVGVLWSK